MRIRAVLLNEEDGEHHRTLEDALCGEYPVYGLYLGDEFLGALVDADGQMGEKLEDPECIFYLGW